MVLNFEQFRYTASQCFALPLLRPMRAATINDARSLSAHNVFSDVRDLVDFIAQPSPTKLHLYGSDVVDSMARFRYG